MFHEPAAATLSPAGGIPAATPANEGERDVVRTAAPRTALLQTGPCNLVSLPPTMVRTARPEEPVPAPPIVTSEKR